MAANRKMIHTYILIFYLTSFLSFNLSGQTTSIWKEGSDYLDITKGVQYIADANKSLQVDDIEKLILKKGLTPIEKPIFNYPLSADVFWFYFELENSTLEDLILTINQSVIADIDIYYRKNSNSLTSKKIDERSIWHEKEIKSHIHGFLLPREVTEYIIRIESRTTPITFKVWNQKSFDRKKSETQNILSLIFGFMLFIVLYNFFIFLTSRRIEYLLYCLLIAGYILFSMVSTGYFHFVIIGAEMWEWYKWIPIVLQPLGMLYAIIFLQIKKHRIAYLIGIVHFIYFMSYWIWNHFLTIPQIALTSQGNAMLGMLVQVGLGIYVGKKGDKLGYYFAAAYLMMAFFGALDISYINFGKPDYIFDINYMILGFLLEVLILSYLLTKRMEWENRAIIESKEDAQKKLVETTLENERIVKDQNVLLEKEVDQRTKELRNSIEELKNTQAQLVQSEKMASLGELTAGIAHEIQNPLNFVNNFAELSVELAKELKEEVEKLEIPEKDKEYVSEIIGDLSQNQEKINHHGKRASSIVKGMLDHSRKNSGIKEMTDINVLCDEYLRLAYHGLRAKDKSFNAEFKTEFDTQLPKVNIIPQDIGRVLLNLINNAFQACAERLALSEAEVSPSAVNEKWNIQRQRPDSVYAPKVTIFTKRDGDNILVEVQDNGSGIPDQIKDKIFQPFFTTKDTGKGTGLGLSLAYDIVKAHGGYLKVETEVGKGSRFIIQIPKA